MKKKVALIGADTLKGSLHLSELRRSDYFELVGIVDENQKDYGRFENFASLQDLFNEVSIDAMIIATNPKNHKENILKCINYTKNILVQAPLANTLSQTREINYAIKTNKINLAVAYNNRFNPAIISLIRELKKEKEIYSLNFINASNEGEILDYLIKDIDLCKFICKSEISNFNLNKTLFGENNTPGILNAAIKLKNEILINFMCSKLYPIRRHKIEVSTGSGFYIADLITFTLHKHTENGLINLRVDNDNFSIRKTHEAFFNFCDSCELSGLADIENSIKIREILC